MLYDSTSKKITGLLDFDWSAITHPAEEFCSGFGDIGGSVLDSHPALVESIVSNGFGARPGGGLMTEKEDVDRWEMGKAWNATAARNGVTLPSDIAGIKSIKAMHDFSSALCPFALSCEPMLKRFSEEQRADKKKAATAAIKQFLDEQAF
ncbi:hypothetical protein NQ176_g11241 [Zarea fungicola]|uniref:Uncharacterized protein n=1 Tax=Zarea fungicola TaxID=93591 RepID=A0ACC1MD85_9HYPO|nr:hypothetical protein NQ176_g11241 [Lecanicillium fungicola]